ncbi:MULTISPECIES: hypothetical protein [Pseudomonas syringae group]|uniref:Uncharacterized protein n=1 Tax=Pseudomonas cannabina TaxID=86840 RepID=A0A3M3KDJ4_PSECA|nr:MULTISPECIES: hypothetical protein [Pseudomonas syringae group]MDH4602424.1 hypothetical protein [Pseudomonas syringae pv. papulans]RMN21124.1 hypothetical protein ALQ64_02806 [Pseudomonas cannabina]
MSITSSKATPAQRAWLEQFERETSFDALHQDALDNGTMTWAQVAQANIDWFEFWAMDAHLAIQKNNPADLEEDAAG